MQDADDVAEGEAEDQGHDVGMNSTDDGPPVDDLAEREATFLHADTHDAEMKQELPESDAHDAEIEQELPESEADYDEPLVEVVEVELGRGRGNYRVRCGGTCEVEVEVEVEVVAVVVELLLLAPNVCGAMPSHATSHLTRPAMPRGATRPSTQRPLARPRQPLDDDGLGAEPGPGRRRRARADAVALRFHPTP